MNTKYPAIFGRLKPHIYTTLEYLLGEKGRAGENAQKPQKVTGRTASEF